MREATNGTGRITLKDIAACSGYSLRTVMKAVNNAGYVSAKAKKAILETAEKLDYKKNRLASILAKSNAYKIALVYADSRHYFPMVEKGFEKCLLEYRDLGFSIEYFKRVTDRLDWQKNVLASILTRDDICAVVLQPLSGTGMNDEINSISDRGKPVITFGSDASNSKRICYVGPKPYKSGRMAAQIMANFIGKTGNVYIINQNIEHMQTMNESMAFQQYMQEKYPDIKVFTVQLPVNDKTYCETVKSIVQNEAVTGIFCTSVNVYLAGNALRDLKRSDITLIGYDVVDETVKMLKANYIKVLIDQEPESLGYLSLKTMCDYLLDSILPEDIYIGDRIITSECLD